MRNNLPTLVVGEGDVVGGHLRVPESIRDNTVKITVGAFERGAGGEVGRASRCFVPHHCGHIDAAAIDAMTAHALFGEEYFALLHDGGISGVERACRVDV